MQHLPEYAKPTPPQTPTHDQLDDAIGTLARFILKEGLEEKKDGTVNNLRGMVYERAYALFRQAHPAAHDVLDNHVLANPQVENVGSTIIAKEFAKYMLCFRRGLPGEELGATRSVLLCDTSMDPSVVYDPVFNVPSNRTDPIYINYKVVSGSDVGSVYGPPRSDGGEQGAGMGSASMEGGVGCGWAGGGAEDGARDEAVHNECHQWSDASAHEPYDGNVDGRDDGNGQDHSGQLGDYVEARGLGAANETKHEAPEPIVEAGGVLEEAQPAAAVATSTDGATAEDGSIVFG